ncbi:ribonuclease H-like protein [Phlegmacium glaucopus]|nr:ribonuclease H-like protein [Phlegmacium glaucopus]
MSGRLSTQTINLSPFPTISTLVYMGWRDLLPIAPDAADTNRIFIPPNPTSRPSDLYSAKLNLCNIPGYRFVRSTDPSEMLMFVDGSALGNGLPTARAGYGVVFAPLQWFSPISDRLEQDGNPQTSNRAELRAVLASLTLRFWAGEGFPRIVLACDSEYVVKGISVWIFKWRRNGWKTVAGNPVANQDLWKKLEAKLREMEGKGMLVQFWKIPREWNEADEYAKAGAVRVFLWNEDLLIYFIYYLGEGFCVW